MKIALQDNRRYMLRFDKDEDVISELSKFMEQNQIAACTFYGIGSALSIELGYFNSHLKEYRRKIVLEDLEIISFIGNGSLVDGKPAVHAHGMFGRTDMTTIGGHVFKMVTLATCEIFLIKFDGQLTRQNNTDFNLNLFE